MNKVNLCWVISDGRKGHEVQSLAVAQAAAHEVHCFTFRANYFQRLLAPNALGHRIKQTHWITHKPLLKQAPDLIISCGRQAAAAANALKQKMPCHHIQILNPKGNLAKYNLLLLPRHDGLKGKNIVQFTGSIHSISANKQTAEVPIQQGTTAVILGNPDIRYWQQQWPTDWEMIKQAHSTIFVCGSPRLSTEAKQIITNCVKPPASIWLGYQDGLNPYASLLSLADQFLVTADSINMMNECLATDQTTQLLATQYVTSKRHLRFIQTAQSHISSKAKSVHTPWPDPMTEITSSKQFQNLLKSPSSLSKG